MKCAVLATIVLLTLCASEGQQLTGDTKFASILPNFHGQIIAYSFPMSPFPYWDPLGHSKGYNWSGSDLILFETVNGVTKVGINDSHDICGPHAQEYMDGRYAFENFGAPDTYTPLPTEVHSKVVGFCTYLGALVGSLKIEAVAFGLGSYQKVSGWFVGAFTDALGNLYTAPAKCYFDTYPATDGIVIPSSGGCDVVFKYN